MNIRYKKIRQIVITGKAEERKKALEYCQEEGYQIVISSPVINMGTSRIDNTRFRIVAEKEI